MNRLKILREEKRLFQKDIANYLDCSIAIISMYEKEQRIMDVRIAQKLADYFNVSIDYLLGKSDIRNPEKIKININETDKEFASRIKQLNETNKMIIKNTLEALLAKQKQDKEKNESE